MRKISIEQWVEGAFIIFYNTLIILSSPNTGLNKWRVCEIRPSIVSLVINIALGANSVCLATIYPPYINRFLCGYLHLSQTSITLTFVSHSAYKFNQVFE